MATGWHPVDWWLEDEGQRGKKEIDRVLRTNNLSLKNIITSRDIGVDMARYGLPPIAMPPGWYSWALPCYLLNKSVLYFFLQVALPGTILPTHQHDIAQFRLVLSGGLLYNGIELRCGDWIYTPAGGKTKKEREGAEYSLSVATNPGQNALIFYCY